ncbi:hypothetical protein CDG77_22430 [Nostoc sp. 'Peltigera membranacea cyanobiont' 213]|nr:hypothetical protein CDG77_22430 [Nostoc sp. 'Peltigera membranacea cyanobiont' 213]
MDAPRKKIEEWGNEAGKVVGKDKADKADKADKVEGGVNASFSSLSRCPPHPRHLPQSFFQFC